MVKFDILLYAVDWTYDEVRRTTLEAERLGFDTVWHHDNVVAMVPFHPEEPVFDAWTLLPALAEATSTVGLGIMVVPVGRRHPALVAKSSSILDRISEGRLNLGFGIGDEDWQFVPWGQAFPERRERVALLRDQLEIARRMWTEDHATYAGRLVSLDGAINAPKPSSPGGPKVWIGLVFGKKVMPKIAAEWADGVAVWTGSDADAREFNEIIDRNCEAIGRDSDEIERSRIHTVAVTDAAVNLEAELERDAERWRLNHAELVDSVATYSAPIIGPGSVVSERLTQSAGLGYGRLALTFAGTDTGGTVMGASAETFIAAMQRFAADVMPAFRKVSR